MKIFNAIIAACLLCVSSVSFVDASEAEDYALFKSIQCQFYASVAGHEQATVALWERNDEGISNMKYELSSYDIAIVVNQQYDHAVTRILNYAFENNVGEKEAAQVMYVKHCNNI